MKQRVYIKRTSYCTQKVPALFHPIEFYPVLLDHSVQQRLAAIDINRFIDFRTHW